LVCEEQSSLGVRDDPEYLFLRYQIYNTQRIEKIVCEELLEF
jgi:hypothetical protein